MPEREAGSYRYDAFAGSWTLVAPARRRVRVAGRVPDALPGLEGECAFCPGNERMTGKAVHVLRRVGAEGWAVRVVENLFPAVRSDLLSGALPPGGRARPAFGAQEVVIECPEHDLDLPDLPLPHLTRLLGVYRDRLRALSSREGIAHVSLFRNRGRRAGSSQPHPHAQLVATQVAGREQAARWRLAREFHGKHGETLLAATLREELSLGLRVVAETQRFVALTPFAPHGPYELWLASRGASGCLRAVPDEALAELAEILSRGIRVALRASGRSAYNLVFRLPPAGALAHPAAFWTLEIRPRGGGPAGLELASGLDVVAVGPEECAAEMRALMD
jgi:UDPglucose--hexose-1-phosphate uridylyltransferase